MHDFNFESFDSENMEDFIVCGSFRLNRDGSITVRCQIDVNHADGRSWSIDDRRIRLPQIKEEPTVE